MACILYVHILCHLSRNLLQAPNLLSIQPDIDLENQVRHRIGNNRSTAWVEGSTRANQLYAWDGDLVGLTACWGTSNDIPIRLFYASSNTTFEEYLWNMKADKWLWQKRWEGYNGAAAVRCLGVSGGNRYVALMNSDNQIEVWYQNKDDNDGSLNWIKCKPPCAQR